ncbi:DeoR/GlpR family DNA-binding transcription regulator [Pseudodonghicola flavimaris]|uniref:DeoR/GlpR family DNA-binding transcription regulator n=1 Tax=Pseudodonghicola flavimaris TaxID=3050036 RepID=A0ABT7EWD5_9RHOB|nr:DeoR/GlpR family DNA-binding transcription regulator [Pseudodonghicola flavimaris]MDK3016604.1 DeoR/GlpR family DNA-binding transcription regulator [Pseudodonghicola flavimaris]
MSAPELARRRDRIVNLLSIHGPLSAADLAGRLGVSVQTIRTDLRELDEQGVIRRRHGEASLSQRSENIGYQPRLAIARDEKGRIGQAVAELIEDGSRLALGTGTTVEEVARALTRRDNLMVATNNIHAVLALRAAPGLTLHLAGGKVRMRDLDIIGADSQDFFGQFRLDVAIFSCGALSEIGEVMDFTPEEIRARRAIAGCADRSILILDSTKIGRPAPLKHGHLWDYDVVVHAGSLPETTRAACTAADCRLIPV